MLNSPQEGSPQVEIESLRSLALLMLRTAETVVANAHLTDGAKPCVAALGVMGNCMRAYLFNRYVYDRVLIEYAGAARQPVESAGVHGTSATDWAIRYGVHLTTTFARHAKVDLFRAEGLSEHDREALERAWPALRVLLKYWNLAEGVSGPAMLVGSHEGQPVYQVVKPPNLALKQAKSPPFRGRRF